MADVKAIITEAATRYGIDPDVALRITTIESTLNPSAQNKNSSAGGLYQFIDSTWSKYGNGKSKYDPYANADAGMRFTRDNINYLKKKLGRDPSPGEIYMAHQQGVGGASLLLSNPGKRAVDVLGHQKVKLNGGNENMTTEEFAGLWHKKMGDTVVPQKPLVSGMTPPSSMGASVEGNGFKATDQGTVPFSAVAPVSNMTDVERFQAEQPQEDAPGLIEGAGLAIWNEWSVMTPFRALGGYDVDPGFSPNEEMIRKHSPGIPNEYLGEFSDAVSEDHMKAIQGRLLEQLEVNQKLASMGAKGVTLSMVAALTDPGAIAATVAIGYATGGLGIAPAVAARLGRVGLVGLGAAEGIAGNLAVDIPLVAVDPTRDATSLAWSVGAGLLMGGAFGALRKNPNFQEEADILGQRGQEIVDGAEERFIAEQGQSSVGAAATGEAGNPMYRTDTEELNGIFKALDKGYSKLNRVRIDVVGQLLKSKNPMVQTMARYLGEDAMRAKKGTTTTAIGATERQQRAFRVSTYNWVKGLDEAWVAHRKANNIGYFQSGEELQKFKLQVRDYIVERDPSRKDQFPAAVKQAGGVWQKEMNKWWQEAKDLGITRSEAGVENYFPRYSDVNASARLINKYGMGKPDDVNKGLTNLFAGAIMQAQPDIDPNLANKIGYAILDRKFKKHAGEDMMSSSMGRVDLDDLEEILEGYVSKEEIKDIKAWLTRNESTAEAGKSNNSRLQHRTLFDENFSMRFGEDEVSIRDFYLKDPNVVFHLYARQMSGVTAMAKIKVRDKDGKLIIDGIKNADDWKKLKDQMKGVGQANDANWDKDSENLDFLYSAITGTPFRGVKENSDWATALRMLRDFNFARLMGQVGFSQIPEIARVTAQVGLKAMMQGMPAFREFVSEFRGGRGNSALANELEQIGAFGTDWSRTKFYVNLDEFGVPVTQGADTAIQKFAAKVNPHLHALNRFVSASSGMAPINAVFQRWASRAFAVKFVRMALHGDKINAERMKALGLTPEMHSLILDQIKKHSEFKDMGNKRAGDLTALNTRKWDTAAAAAFEDALFRASRNMILENDAGQFSKWMGSPLGKTFMQFRTFAVGSFTKALLQGANLRDIEATMGFIGAYFLGAMVYLGQTHMQLALDPDRAKKIKERTSLDKLALAGFQRTSESSLLPVGMDMMSEMLTGEPMFDMRSSGLKSTADNLFGNPTMDLVSTGFKAVKGVTTAVTGDDYSAQDFTALAKTLPLQRNLAVQNILSMVTGNLSREQRERN